MMNLNDLAEQAHTIADMRGQKTEVFSALKHCSGEVAEAIEANFWYNDCRTTNSKAELASELASELADIIICVLTASYEAGINIEEALNEAMQKNARRAYEKS